MLVCLNGCWATWSLFVYNAGFVSDLLPRAGMIYIISNRYVEDVLLGELATYSPYKKCMQFIWECFGVTPNKKTPTDAIYNGNCVILKFKYKGPSASY